VVAVIVTLPEGEWLGLPVVGLVAGFEAVEMSNL
jgi:hypothetical protein